MDSKAKIATTGNTCVMINTSAKMHEHAAATAFGKQARIFDQLYEGNTIIDYKRKKSTGSCDAVPASQFTYTGIECRPQVRMPFILHKHGHSIHATDISMAMQGSAY